MPKLRITVNKQRCISSGDCIETASAVFQFGEDGKSKVVNPTAVAGPIILAAVRSCPVKAITVINGETGEQLFPPPRR